MNTRGNKKKHMKINVLFISIVLIFSTVQAVYSKIVLKGGVSSVMKEGNHLDINLNTPINFYFSLPGDKVAAYIPKDIKIGELFYIPKGSRVEGILTKINKPKHLGVDGSFEIDFNKIITPNNISIPIYATVSTDTSSKGAKIAKALTYDSALISYGALHGALAGIEWGGIPLAVSSHGISVLAGASVGASFGLIGSIKRKGKVPAISNLVPTSLELKSDFFVLGELPEIKRQTTGNKQQIDEFKGFRFTKPPKKEEIEITIQELRKENSKEYGDYLVLEINLTNNSNKKVNLSDLALLNEEGFDPIHPDILLTGADALETVEPFKTFSTSIAFSVRNNKLNYDLALIDPLDNTEIVRIPLKIED